MERHGFDNQTRDANETVSSQNPCLHFRGNSTDAEAGSTSAGLPRLATLLLTQIEDRFLVKSHQHVVAGAGCARRSGRGFLSELRRRIQPDMSIKEREICERVQSVGSLLAVTGADT